MSDNKAVYPSIKAEIATLLNVQGTPAIIVPEGCTLETFEGLRKNPARVERIQSVTSAASFLAYFNRFANPSSTIFVDVEKAKINGIIDFHGPQAGAEPIPHFCSHRVTYDCPLTPEAKKWFDSNRQQMNQTEFALFIEDGLLEIAEPAGAQMLEIASTLHAKTAVNFRSGVRLDNGQVQMTYEESVQGQAGTAGQLSIPQKIVLHLRIFRGDDVAYRLEANFRYRVKEGKLTMWYELIRPHVAREDAVKTIVKAIETGISTGHIVEAVV